MEYNRRIQNYGEEWGCDMRLDVCGAKVEVQVSGSGQRAALLLHGWGCSAQMMSSVGAYLEKNMRVAAIDFPGHGMMGKASEPPVPWGVQEYMEMTAEIIRRLELAPCDIVAHSFGCRVAILLASTYPELVGRMVFTGAAGIRKPAAGKATARQKLYKGLRGAMNALDKVHIFGDLPEKGREALVQKFGSPDYRVLTPLMRQTFNKVITLDLTDRLQKIQSSTLLYWGAQDTETPLWMGEMMQEKIPDAGLVIEEGCGHFAYLEQNAKFLRIVGSFLLEGR